MWVNTKCDCDKKFWKFPGKLRLLAANSGPRVRTFSEQQSRKDSKYQQNRGVFRTLLDIFDGENKKISPTIDV